MAKLACGGRSLNRRVAAYVLIIVGLLAATLQIFRRVEAEESARQVELTMDLDEATVLAADQAYSLDRFLAGLREAGLTSVAVSETTLDKFQNQGRVALFPGSALLTMARWEFGGPDGTKSVPRSRTINPRLLYVVAADRPTYDLVSQALTLHLPPGELDRHPDQLLIGAPISENASTQLRLGIDPVELQMATRAGLAVIPRFVNYPGITAEAIERDFAAVKRQARISSVIFGNLEVPGYPELLPATARELKSAGASFGLIETGIQLGHVDQAGKDDLARLTGYGAVRVYSMLHPEQDKLTPDGIAARQVRAVKERDIRILYLRPVLKAGHETDLIKVNLRHVADVAGQIKADHFVLGPARAFPSLRPGPLLLWLIAAGIIGGGVVLLDELWPLPVGLYWGLLALGLAGSLGIFTLSRGALARLALALGAAVTYPTLAAVWAAGAALRSRASSLGQVVGEGVKALVLASLVAIAGAWFISSLLADNRYLLEIDYFRGVKVAVTLPLLLVIWIFVRRWGLRREPGPSVSVRGEVEWLLDRPILVKHALLLSFVAFAFYVYIGRTGNTPGIGASAVEVGARDWLERLLVARPRTKEFLIGDPALMLAFWAAWRGYREWVLPLVVTGAIALSSMVNSFQHLRTEFLLSLWRGGNGVWLGALVGVVGIVAVEMVYRAVCSAPGTQPDV